MAAFRREGLHLTTRALHTAKREWILPSFLFSINRNETTKISYVEINMRNQFNTTKNLKKLKIMQILLLLKLSRLIIGSIG